MDSQAFIQQLIQLLQPSEAEAAPQRQTSVQGPTANPMIDWLAKLQATQAASLQSKQTMALFMQGLQQQAQTAKQATPQAQAQLAVTQAKAQPTPDLATLLGMGTGGGDTSIESPTFPGDTFGGGPGAPITFGTNPRTGEQSFNNFGWVNQPTQGSGRAFNVAQQYSSPEAIAQVEAARPKAGGAAVPNKAKVLAEIQAWKTVGVTPPKAVVDGWGEALTGIKKPNPVEAKADQWVTDNQSMLVHRQTGAKLIELPELPDSAIVKKDYVKMKQKQIDNIDTLSAFDVSLAQYNELLPLLEYPEEGLGVLSSGVARKYKGMTGNDVVNRLQALNAQITQQAKLFGGDSRVSETELDLLQKSVLGMFNSKKGAQGIMKILEDFRNGRAKSIGIPGLYKRQNVVAQPGAQATSEAPRKIRRTDDGRTGTLLPGATLPAGHEFVQ